MILSKSKLAVVEQSETPNRLAWAHRINTAWQQNVTGILEVGRLLIEAKDVLLYGDFGKMFEAGDVNFSLRTAEYLMDIARDKRLTDPKHVSHLPPHWGTLKELTQLSDDVFEAALQDGTINPDMTRADAKKLQPTPTKKEGTEPDLAKQYLRMVEVMGAMRDALDDAGDRKRGADNLTHAIASLGPDARQFKAETEQGKGYKLYVAEVEDDTQGFYFVAKNPKAAQVIAQNKFKRTLKNVREATAAECEKFKQEA